MWFADSVMYFAIARCSGSSNWSTGIDFQVLDGQIFSCFCSFFFRLYSLCLFKYNCQKTIEFSALKRVSWSAEFTFSFGSGSSPFLRREDRPVSRFLYPFLAQIDNRSPSFCRACRVLQPCKNLCLCVGEICLIVAICHRLQGHFVFYCLFFDLQKGWKGAINIATSLGRDNRGSRPAMECPVEP